MADSKTNDGLVTTVADATDRCVLRLDPRDTVGIALSDLRHGQRVSVEGEVYDLVTDVPAKHKFALAAVRPGDHVIMYGAIWGRSLTGSP